jgi:hypothetical protein
LLVSGALVLLFGSTAARIQQPLLVRGAEVPVGPGSGQILLVDINHDGHVDLIARHLLRREVSVFLGDGSGQFRRAANGLITLPYQPGMIAVDDLNRDGNVDLAISISERDDVDVLAGTGTGEFTRVAGSPFVAGPSRDFYTRSIYIADVNEDGRPDLLTANGRNSTFAVLFGADSWRFRPGPVLRHQADPALEREDFAVGDIDGDGHVDVLVATRTDDVPQPGRLAVFRGDGKGGFVESPLTAVVPASPHFVRLVDVNGDRRLDLVMSHAGSRTITVLLNSGGMRFESVPGSPLDAGQEAFDIAAADVDGDGHVDLAAATGTTARVWLGDGRGRFVPAMGSPFAAGPGAYHLSVKDVNEDGRPDVLMPNFEGDAATVWLSAPRRIASAARAQSR